VPAYSGFRKERRYLLLCLGCRLGPKDGQAFGRDATKNLRLSGRYMPEPHAWAWTRAPALFRTQVVYTRQCGREHHIKLSVEIRSCKDGLMTRAMLLLIFACFSSLVEVEMLTENLT